MSQNEGRRIIKSFSALTIVIIIAKLAGFFKQMVIAWSYGATAETDLIQISLGLIGDAEYIIIQTLNTAFVALYIHIRETDREKAKEFTANITKALLTVALGAVALFVALAPVISRLIAPSYSPELSSKLAGYIKIFSPAIFLYMLIAVCISVLNANKRYVPGEMRGLIQSMVLILTIICLNDLLHVNTLVAGTLIYAVVASCLYLRLSATYFHFTRGNPFKDSHVKEFLSMCSPLMLGYAMLFINQQVDKILVSGMTPGTVTAMGYGQVLYNLLTTIIASLCTVLFTYLAEMNSRNDIEGTARMAENASFLMLTVLLPVTIVTCFASTEIVSVVFDRGAFDQQAVRGTVYTLIGYGIGLIGFSIKSLYARVLYSNKDTKSPMINSSIGIAVNIVLSIILSRKLGVFGVTLASSISEYIAAVLNILSSKKTFPGYKSNIRVEDAGVISIATALCIITAQALTITMDLHNNLVRLIVYTAACFAVFYISSVPVVIRYTSLFR